MKNNKLISPLLCMLIMINGCNSEEKITTTTPKDSITSYTAKDVKLSQYNWQGDIPASGTIRINNPYGNISTKNTNFNNISISGAIQLIGENAKEPIIEVNNDNGTTVLTVLYPNGDTDSYGRKIGRVDLGVYVPRNVRVDLQTDYGAIKARKHQSNMILKSNSGEIKVGTSGTVQIKSSSGDIKFHIQKVKDQDNRFIESNKKRHSSIISETGNIALTFGNDLDIEFDIQAQSEITTNLASFKEILPILHTPQQIKATLGKATNYFEIQSQQGDVSMNISRVKPITNNVSSPISFNGNINDLPTVKPWKPGDEIIEIQDGKSDRTKKDTKKKD